MSGRRVVVTGMAGVCGLGHDWALVGAGLREGRSAVAYWPPGKALCLFFGQRPYSPVNVVGEIEGDPRRRPR